MFQLTYISTARPDIGSRDVDQILAASRRRNDASGLTGLLIFDGVRFLQAIEGERDPLFATYERIKADRRHRAVVLLSSREVAAREFGDWAMAWNRVDRAAQGSSLAATVDALVLEVPDPNTRELFRSFARLNRNPRAAAA